MREPVSAGHVNAGVAGIAAGLTGCGFPQETPSPITLTNKKRFMRSLLLEKCDASAKETLHFGNDAATGHFSTCQRGDIFGKNPRMKKIMALSAIVLLAMTTGVRSQTTAPSVAKTPDRETLGKALAVLGKVKTIQLVATSSELHKKDALNKAVELFKKKVGDLKDKPLAPAPLLDLAADIYNAEDGLGLDVAVSDPQDLKSIQKILGSEGVKRTPRPDDAEEGWRYKYGRWEFRAVGGSVKYVLLYCSTSRKN